MAKFCTKCGKKLEDGMVCDCEKKASTASVAPATQSGFDFNSCINSYIDMIKGIFTKPVDTIKKYATSNNLTLGIIAIVLNCIVSGIFLYCLCNEAIDSLSSLLGYSSLLYSSSVEVEFMDVFPYGVLFMAVYFFVTALIVYVIANPILKDSKMDIKKAISLVGVVSVFTTITTLVCILLTYISFKFMAIVLILACVFYLTYLYQGISDTTEVDKNKLAYIFVPSIAVATFVMVYVLPKILF